MIDLNLSPLFFFSGFQLRGFESPDGLRDYSRESTFLYIQFAKPVSIECRDIRAVTTFNAFHPRTLLLKNLHLGVHLLILLCHYRIATCVAAALLACCYWSTVRTGAASIMPTPATSKLKRKVFPRSLFCSAALNWPHKCVQDYHNRAVPLLRLLSSLFMVR